MKITVVFDQKVKHYVEIDVDDDRDLSDEDVLDDVLSDADYYLVKHLGGNELPFWVSVETDPFEATAEATCAFSNGDNIFWEV